jgi:chromosome partitioning protein
MSDNNNSNPAMPKAGPSARAPSTQPPPAQAQPATAVSAAPAATAQPGAAAHATKTAAAPQPGLRIFCVANQKGGVGKTTTTVNLAAGLAQIGLRVLVVDLDPQGNATMGSGINKRELPKTIYDVLLEPGAISDARVPSPKGGYDVLGANRELAGAEVELVPLPERERRLRQALATVQTDYDFVLIDCPPSLSLLTLNGLVAAHGVIVPMQCEYFALEGLSDLVNTVKQVHANLNPDLQLIGLLRVMFDPRITLQQQVSDQLKSHFGDKVFNTVIPRNVRLAEAPSYGLPGVVFDPASRGAVAFVEFARELAQRLR